MRCYSVIQKSSSQSKQWFPSVSLLPQYGHSVSVMSCPWVYDPLLDVRWLPVLPLSSQPPRSMMALISTPTPIATMPPRIFPSSIIMYPMNIPATVGKISPANPSTAINIIPSMMNLTKAIAFHPRAVRSRYMLLSAHIIPHFRPDMSPDFRTLTAKRHYFACNFALTATHSHFFLLKNHRHPTAIDMLTAITTGYE